MFWQFLIIGVSVGSIYAAVALGLVLIYRATNVVNFAQGEFVMLGGFLAYTLLGCALPFWLVVILTVILMGLIGLLSERFVLRKISSGPLIAIIMITLGLSIFVKGTATIIWGTNNYVFPNVFPGQPLQVGGIMIQPVYFWSIFLVLLLFVLFAIFFKYTNWGLAMRATADNQMAAASLGIRTLTVITLSWVIAGFVAGIGGILLSSVTVLNTNISIVGLIAFPVVILGGLDSPLGAVVGGLFIGVLESLAAGYISPAIGGASEQVVAYLTLLIILLLKPYGLFGRQGIERL